MSMDKDYRDKIGAALWEAILKTSVTPATNAAGKPVAAIMSGECISALSMTIALLLATSEESSTPKKLREACERIAKDIRLKTAEVQKQGTAGVFDDIVSAPADPQ